MSRYEVLDHACRHCGGRLLQSAPDDSGQIEVRCAECGASTHGALGIHVDLCHCGLTDRQGRDANLRCVRRDKKQTAIDTDVVVIYSGPDLMQR